MGAHDRVMRINFPAALSQIIDQLFTGFELAARWLIAIEIAHQANPQGDVVQIIAVDVPAIDLTPPPIAHFDLSIAGGGAVSNHEMIGEAILHVANMPMVIIEHARVSLSCAAIVHYDELPATPLHRRAPDGVDD